MLLPNQIKQFLQEPRFYWLATRDANMICEINRVLGVQISGPDSLRIFMYQGTGVKTRENLLLNRLVAFSVTSGFTFESYQFKGKLIEIRQATSEEEEFIENYILDMDKMMATLGYNMRGIVTNTMYKPSWSIEFEVEQIFEQTPKVGTGNLLTTV